MFALNLYWSWTSRFVVIPGAVCIAARLAYDVAVMAGLRSTVDLASDLANRVDVIVTTKEC